MSATNEQQAMNESEEKNEDGTPKQQVTLEQALKLAQGHHRNGNFAIAERTYRDILRAVPDNPEATYLLAAVLFQRGNIREALKYGKLSTELRSEDAGTWSNYAAMLSADKDYEGALEAYDQAIYLNPELCETYVNKAHTLWLMKRYQEAEEAAMQATLLDPEKIEAYMNLGISLASQGKTGEAEDVWKQVIELEPESAAAYSNWCNTLRNMGDLRLAKEKGLKAVALAPESSDAQNNLGCVYRDLGEYDDAVACFKKAVDLRPDYVDAHINLAHTYLGMERFSDALVSGRYATSFDPDNAGAHIVMALAYKNLGQKDEARSSADKAIGLEPNDPYHYLILAEILTSMDSEDEAYAILQKALELNPHEPYTLMKLAEVQRSLDMMDDALASINKAIAEFQETPQLLVDKTRILIHANRLDEAMETINRGLELYPQHPSIILNKADLLLTVNRKDEAREVIEGSRHLLENAPGFYINIGDYKKFTEDDPDFKKLVSMQENADALGPEMKTNLFFALFSAYETIGDYDTAFEWLEKANKERGQVMGVDAKQLIAAHEARVNAFSADTIEQYKNVGFESDVPVFVCGMPRSGTTLTEQIISSHPDVYGAGELYDLSNVIRERGPLTINNAREMGEAYVEKIKKRDKSGAAKRITDKMPANYNNIGLIKCILPHAKIIHCRRNPMDNLLSCYKQNFAVGQYWSYDQDMLAENYILYSKTIEHWRQHLPHDAFIDVDYEETVNNFEEQARRLIDYVGLEWDDACLEPHKQKRAVLTASKDQVIKPVYKTSIEAWRRYEKQLQPLYTRLKDAGLVE